MTDVVLRKEKRRQGLDLAPRCPLAEGTLEQALEEEFFLEPDRDGRTEGVEPARSHGQIRLDQPLEFDERLVVERHIVDRRE